LTALPVRCVFFSAFPRPGGLLRVKLLNVPRQKTAARTLAWLAGLALAAAFSTGASASEPESWREIPYQQFHAFLTAVKPVENARYLSFSHAVDVSPPMTREELRIIVRASSGDIVAGIGPDGTLDFPLSDALLEENPPVRLNAPEGGLSLTMNLAVNAEPALRFPYATLVDMADEYRQLVRQQGVVARMAAPAPAGLAVLFSPGEPATATLSGRRATTFEAGQDGRVLIPLRREWTRENPEITLSRMPELVSLDFGR
jgi:hypothetical protein